MKSQNKNAEIYNQLDLSYFDINENLKLLHNFTIIEHMIYQFDCHYPLSIGKSEKMKTNNQNTSDPEIKPRFKTVLIGDGGVGKTSLKRSYLGLDFIDNYQMTIGVDVSSKKLGKNILQIWDLGGQRGFQQIFGDYFAKTEGAVVVFDITNPKSFENVNKWIEMITIEKKQMIPTVLVGNKSDLRNRGLFEISYLQGLDFAKELSNNSIFEIPYIEASALTGLNVSHIFESLVTTIITISNPM